eukprot:4674617-Karenia_brevis.AAC.1
MELRTWQNLQRGSCSRCHAGRTCPLCADYCLQRRPEMCKRCPAQTPSPALSCHKCFSSEELQERLC